MWIWTKQIHQESSWWDMWDRGASGVVLPVYTWSQWDGGSLEVMAYQSPIRVPSKQHSCSAPRSGYRAIQYRALWLL